MVHGPAWEKRRRGLRGGEGLGGAELAQGHTPLLGVRGSPGSFGFSLHPKAAPLGSVGSGALGRAQAGVAAVGHPGWVAGAGAWRAGRAWRGAELAAGGAVPGLGQP